MILKNSDVTSKKTHVSITKVNWVLLFKEIIAVYFEANTKPAKTLCGQNAELLIVKVDGTCSYH
jgi:hypothetical protein